MLPFTAFSSDKRYSEDNKKMSVDVFCDEEPPSTRKVVMQLHALSADPDSQVSMVHEHNFVPSLMKYSRDEEDDIALLAAKSIQFLSSHPKNKEIMANNEDLVDCLRGLTLHNNEKIREIAQTCLIQLSLHGGYHESTCNTNSSESQNPLKTRILTFTVKGLEDEILSKIVERRLISQKGVISVTLDPKNDLAVVCTKCYEDLSYKLQDIIDGIIVSRSPENSKISNPNMLNTPLQPQKPKGPRYLDDVENSNPNTNDAITMYGFTSLEAQLAQKKREEEEALKKRSAVTSFLGRFARAIASVI